MKSLLDKRPKVKIIPLEEALDLERTQQLEKGMKENSPSKLQQDEGVESESEDEKDLSDRDSDDDEPKCHQPTSFLSLSLFAQLLDTLSGWPSERSREFLRRSRDQSEAVTTALVGEMSDMEEEFCDSLPISDSDQERARWKATQGLLLRELPGLCARLHISVPLHNRLARFLETCFFSRPLTLKPRQLCLVVMVLIDVLGQTDEVLQEELAASAMQKKTILASHGIEEDCWKLLVGLFQ